MHAPEDGVQITEADGRRTRATARQMSGRWWNLSTRQMKLALNEPYLLSIKTQDAVRHVEASRCELAAT